MMGYSSNKWYRVGLLLIIIVIYSGVKAVKCDGNEAKVNIVNISDNTMLYSKFTSEYIGAIVGEKLKHKFPNETIQDAVKIKYKDGSVGYLPKKSLRLLYITK